MPLTFRLGRMRPVRCIVCLAAAFSVTGCRATLGTHPEAGTLPNGGLGGITVVPVTSAPLRITSDRDVAISPDGARIGYIAGTVTGPTQLMLRVVGQAASVPIEGTSGASAPFFSPDGLWIGFFVSGELRKVPIAGGAVVTICRISGGARGASWGSNDTIVFATSAAKAGLMSVPGAGGAPRVLTTPDSLQGERAHQFPAVLPGGRGVVFTIQRSSTPVFRDIVFAPIAGVGLLDLRTGQRKTLLFRGGQAEYVEGGYLIYAGAGTLDAVRFDLDRLETVGDPVRVFDHVMTKLNSAADFSVARSGTLVYVPGGAGGQEWKARELVWVDRDKEAEEPIPMPSHNYGMPRLSPDGSKVAVNMIDAARGNFDHGIGIWDITRRRLTQLSMIDVAAPVWTADGRRIIAATEFAAGPPASLVAQSADGTGPVERLTTSTSAQIPLSVSRDGAALFVLEQSASGTGANSWQLGVLSLRGPSALTDRARNEPLNATKDLSGAELSPDGHWLAYSSDASGRDEVYVRPFPGTGSSRGPVAIAVGSEPLWARDGRELFYVDGEGFLASATIEEAPDLIVGASRRLLHTRYFSTGNFAPLRNYDVSPDGRRFLMVKDPAVHMQVVRGWADELKRRLAAATLLPR